MSKANSELLDQLHAATAKGLFDRINSGEATAADFAAAAKFLRDNGVVAPPQAPAAVSQALIERLPYKSAEQLQEEQTIQ